MRIRGLILLYPYFGGEARTASETKDRREVPLFTVEDSDLLWRLALPTGSNRDHHFCNPLAPHTGALDVWSLAGTLPPTVMVIGGRDILRDKQLEYCEFLKKCDKQIIEILEFEEEDHGFTLVKIEQPSSMKLIEYASHFIKSAA
jgi:acetyl esterase/lipase